MDYNIIFDITFLLLFAWVALYATAVPQGDKRWWGLLAAMAALVGVGMALGRGLWRTWFIDAAAFVAAAMVATRGTPKALDAMRHYLALLVLSVVCIGAGLLLGGEGATPPGGALPNVVAALLLVGFAIKLALLPFYFWLPGVAESAAPMTTALIVSVVDVAAFTELVHLRQVAPWVFADHAALWLVLALLSMFGGALLALAQRDLKRMLAFSTVDDMGYLLLGVTVGSDVGLAGALLGALSHALLKVLLFGAVGLVEGTIGEPVTLDNSRGLAARFPVSGAVFIVGSLGMIGVPPLFGFVGRWRLYLTGAEYGGPALVLAMAVATGLALLYYARAIHRVWLGRPEGITVSYSEPRTAKGVLVALAVVVLLLGVFPGWMTGVLG